LSAVTRTDLTTIVSSSTPNATANPSSVIIVSGSFPLGPALGELGFRHEPALHHRVFWPPDFSGRLTPNRGYTTLLNLRLWEDAERFVLAHPPPAATAWAVSQHRPG
jgi:hypothetical protein